MVPWRCSPAMKVAEGLCNGRDDTTRRDTRGQQNTGVPCDLRSRACHGSPTSTQVEASLRCRTQGSLDCIRRTKRDFGTGAPLGRAAQHVGDFVGHSEASQRYSPGSIGPVCEHDMPYTRPSGGRDRSYTPHRAASSRRFCTGGRSPFKRVSVEINVPSGRSSTRRANVSCMQKMRSLISRSFK